MTSIPPACPDCGAALGAGPYPRCPACRLPLAGPEAAALWQVVTALQALDAQRRALTRQRDDLLAVLRGRRDLPDPPPARTPTPQPREVSGPSVQTVLLVLGGLLVTIAALVFTVVSWGDLGLVGRTAVLLAVTACALLLPLPLRRRSLTATAEAAAGIGLALVLLDGYAGLAAGLVGQPNPARYWAILLAALSVAALGYGWALRLRFPLAVGFLLTRAPAPLLLSAAGVTHVQAYATAVVGGAVLDAVLLRAVGRFTAGRADDVRQRLGGLGLWRAATVLAVAWAVLGGLVAAVGGLLADGVADAARAWAPLGALAVLGLAGARLAGNPAFRRTAAAGAGAAVLLAAGGTLHPCWSSEWTAVAYGAPAVLVLVAAAVVLRRDTAGPAVGALGVAACGLALTTLPALPELLRAALAPLARASATWAGGAAPDEAWRVAPAELTMLALLVVALAAVTALRIPGAPTPALAAATAGAAVPALALLPVATDLPYPVAVGTAGLLALGGAAVLRPDGPTRPAALTTVAVAGPIALVWASAERAAAIAVLAVCVVAAAVAAWRAVGPRGDSVQAALGGACAVLALGVEAAAVGDTAGLAGPDTLLAVLGVAVATVPVAARTARLAPAELSRSIEATGCLLALVALLLTLGHPGRLTFDLAIAGVAVLAVALRADRRPAAPVVASILLAAAWWLRLALWNVPTPEAYTGAVAVAALIIGRLRRRRDRSASSWATYGPGLGLLLLPSLYAVLTDGYWLRPLLLGVGALAVTVLGVRHRMQAPLVLGGGTLLVAAVHELAPTVVQVLGLLPRWVPPAAVGLLLLGLGASYEQRLRDARRLRDGLRRLG